MITINIWSDFACPFCYIGEKRLLNAIEELGMKDNVDIKYRAFELDPSALPESSLTAPQRISEKYHISLQEAEKRVEAMSAMGNELGLDFNYAKSRLANTFDAHRLMLLAENKYDKETVAKLNLALFDAYFSKGLQISDPKVLKSIGEKAGIKKDDIETLLNGVEYGPEVRLDEDEAAAMGVRGVPYIVFNSKYAVPGAVSQQDFKQILQQLASEKQDSQVPADSGETCDDTGCCINN